MNMQERIEHHLGKTIREAADREVYFALLSLVQEEAARREHKQSKKKVYYISAEFLIGKLLSNNLINLGIFDEVKQVLADGYRTGDIMSEGCEKVGCSRMGDLLAERIC